jgi:hypothetical protein
MWKYNFLSKIFPVRHLVEHRYDRAHNTATNLTTACSKNVGNTRLWNNTEADNFDMRRFIQWAK